MPKNRSSGEGLLCKSLKAAEAKPLLQTWFLALFANHSLFIFFFLYHCSLFGSSQVCLSGKYTLLHLQLQQNLFYCVVLSYSKQQNTENLEQPTVEEQIFSTLWKHWLVLEKKASWTSPNSNSNKRNLWHECLYISPCCTYIAKSAEDDHYSVPLGYQRGYDYNVQTVLLYLWRC